MGERTTLESGIAEKIVVTQSDSVDLPQPTRGILVDADATLRVTYVNDPDGTTDDVVLAPGVWHPMRVKRIWSTGTNVADSVIHAGR